MNRIFKIINTNGQVSDSVPLAVVLSLSGGAMDAYTYLLRDNVFANAQTGNLLLFGVYLSEGNSLMAKKYLFPILAFACGITLSELIRHSFKTIVSLHWRQISVLTEGIILFAVGFFSLKHNSFANAFVSFACGIQVQSFRKVNGYSSATTMCIGNLRAATQNFCNYIFTGDKLSRKKSYIYFGIIGSFILGAILSNRFILLFHEKAIWFSSILMLICHISMFIKPEH